MTEIGDTSGAVETLVGATDTHLHIFEPGYPLNPTVPTHAEPAAGVAEYRVEMARLGLSRAVIVQPSAYGTDNRCTLVAMAALGKGARGVAILPEDIADANISRLAALGMRGLRCLLDQPGSMMTWERTVRMAPRFVEYGWHINLQFAGHEFPERAATIHALPGTLVIDHLGKFAGVLELDGPAFTALLRLLDTGRAWVKLSAPYHADRSGPPEYRDVRALARHLVAHAPERCLWASNWPHPGRTPRPDSVTLRALLEEWAPDASTRRRILVDNPAQLYGFSEADRVISTH
jgi:D-galactarolactone isomerase